MCGRYAITSAPEAFRRLFAYPEQPNFPARYNVAPTQPIPVVRIAAGGQHFVLMRWGLIPPWVEDPKRFPLLINARGESAAEKPAFRHPLRRRRCLVPADGFYEWRAEGKLKRPFFIRRKDQQPFAFAGVWDTWRGPNGEEMDGAAIVTTAANATLSVLHERMPVILQPDAFDAWLNAPETDLPLIQSLIAPAPDDLLEAFEVSPDVNKVANDAPHLIEPYTAPPATAEPAKPARRAAASEDRQGNLF